MKPQLFLVSLFFLIIQSASGQQNNLLRGKVLFLNSGKTPAVGVEVSGSIKGMEKANSVYTLNDGAYQLIFPNARDGYSVHLNIGSQDEGGRIIEVVNGKEVENCRIPAVATDEFEIIVCTKGSRDLVAQRYYKILKTSADIALAQKEKEYYTLQNERQKDFTKIAKLTAELAKLQEQTDSLTIYKEAFQIASINKDNATRRVLRYIQLLDEDKSVQEARKELSIGGASKDWDKGLELIEGAIEELVLRANISKIIFDYGDAIICYDTLISKSIKTKLDASTIANYCVEAASINFFGGKYHKSLSYYNKYLDLNEGVLASNDNDLANIYSDIGNVYHVLGQYQRAVEYQQKTINIKIELLGLNNPQLANPYSSIGNTYRELGQYQKALEYQKKSVEIWEKLGNNNHHLANSYGNIGNTYLALGLYDEALEYQTKSLKIFETIWGNDNPELATPYNNVSLTYRALGLFNKALEYQEKTISILEKKLNPKHPKLATSYHNIALTLQSLKKYKIALIYQEKSKIIQEENVETNETGLANLYGSIGNTYKGLKQYEKALEYFKKSIVIGEAIYDSSHPTLSIYYINIALNHEILKNYDESLKYFQKAIRIQQSNLDREHLDLGFSYEKIANVYYQKKQFSKALLYQTECFLIYEKKLPDNHPSLIESFSNLISLYYYKGVYDFENKDYSTALKGFLEYNKYIDDKDSWNYTVLCYIYLSDDSNARVTLYEYEEKFPNDSMLLRNWAIYYALKKDKEKALLHLEKAIELGYDDIEWLNTDDSLNNLRKEKEFIETIKKLEKKKND